jgi:hypothetical protein
MSKSASQFTFDGRTLVAIQKSETLELPVAEWDEIGIALAHEHSFESGFALVVNCRGQKIHIPSDAHVSKALLDHFCLLKGFKWKHLVDARLNPASSYSVCWRRPGPSLTLFTCASVVSGLVLATIETDYSQLDALAKTLDFATLFIG